MTLITYVCVYVNVNVYVVVQQQLTNNYTKYLMVKQI